MDIKIMTDTGSDLTQDDKAKYDIIEMLKKRGEKNEWWPAGKFWSEDG